MAREASITQDQVNAAADKIRADGSNPTARAVRESLGAGSMATILKYFQIWKSGQSKAPVHDISLPVTIQRQLTDFIAQEVASSRTDLQNELLLAQQNQTDLIAENERLLTQIEALLDESETCRKITSEQAGQLEQIETQCANLQLEVQQERAAAERARIDLAKAELRLEMVPKTEAKLEEMRAEYTREHQLRTTTEQQLAVQAERLESVSEQATKGRVTIEKLEETILRLTNENFAAQQKIQSQQLLLESANSGLKEATQERQLRTTAEQQLAVLNERLESLSERLGEDKATIGKLEKSVQQLTQENYSSKQHIQAQQLALDSAARELEEAKKATNTARELVTELRGQTHTPREVTTPVKKRPSKILPTHDKK